MAFAEGRIEDFVRFIVDTKDSANFFAFARLDNFLDCGINPFATAKAEPMSFYCGNSYCRYLVFLKGSFSDYFLLL